MMDARWWQRSYRIINRVLQAVTGLVMLIIALDWAIGDGSYRAMLAVLGAVLTVAKVLERRDCDDEI